MHGNNRKKLKDHLGAGSLMLGGIAGFGLLTSLEFAVNGSYIPAMVALGLLGVILAAVESAVVTSAVAVWCGLAACVISWYTLAGAVIDGTLPLWMEALVGVVALVATALTLIGGHFLLEREVEI